MSYYKPSSELGVPPWLWKPSGLNCVMLVKQCHQPPMTGNGFMPPTYGDLGIGLILFCSHYRFIWQFWEQTHPNRCITFHSNLAYFETLKPISHTQIMSTYFADVLFVVQGVQVGELWLAIVKKNATFPIPFSMRSASVRWTQYIVYLNHNLKT